MPIELKLGTPAVPVDRVADAARRRQARFLWRALGVLIFLAFCLVLRMFAFEGALVTSGSMETTLFKGDYLLADHRIALRGQWNRGDIVLFVAPESWDSEGQTLIKRIIGMPGDILQVYHGIVYINNKALPQKEYLSEAPDPEEMIGPFKLKAGEYFVMGDNRNNSDDSRNNGPINEKDIQSRAVFKLWPPTHFGAPTAGEYQALATNF